MKRAVMTALAVTLLSGTSALAQGGPLSRAVREAQDQRAPAPQRESRPQQQQERQQPQPQPQAAPSQSQSRGDDGRRGRDGGGQPAAAAVQQAQQQQAQRQQGGWQGQRRPDGQASQGQNWQGQGRPGGQGGQAQGRPQGQDQRGPDRQQGQGRPDGQYDRDRRDDAGPLARAVREGVRQGGGYDNRGPGWNNNDRDQGRRPVIRPEDRRDRDRNRPRYDQRRFPHYVTSHQRYRWYGPIWRPPVGFYSFRWQWGQTLPWSWYTPDYYLNDYWRYGLPMPPIGCEWVRVGDDAILVDVFNGRVYQVVYDLFW